MSILQPSLLTLDKGLNLQTAKIVAPAGSVLDSLNYEQVDFQGQKRIDGYIRYDGGLGSYIDEYYVVTTNNSTPVLPGTPVFDTDGKLLGIIVQQVGPEYIIVIIDKNIIPSVDDSLQLEGGSLLGTIQTIAEGKEVHTAEDHYNNLLQFNSVLRARATSLPGPVAGLHWFRDRLYAISDALTLELFLDALSPTINVNDIIQVNSSKATILKIIERGGITKLVLDADNFEDWLNTGADVYTDIFEYVGTLGNNLFSEIAQLYQSRTEQQAGTELINYEAYGWDSVHLGWSVPFEEGISLYGSLPSLNQNIQDIGIQGPTSTTGGNGRVLTLTQKVVIDGQEEVNGWKGSNTPTTYSLDVENIKEIDVLSIYADAYVTWDGDSGSVDAPGAQNPPLREYSPTNTVKVSVV